MALDTPDIIWYTRHFQSLDIAYLTLLFRYDTQRYVYIICFVRRGRFWREKKKRPSCRQRQTRTTQHRTKVIYDCESDGSQGSSIILISDETDICALHSNIAEFSNLPGSSQRLMRTYDVTLFTLAIPDCNCFAQHFTSISQITRLTSHRQGGLRFTRDINFQIWMTNKNGKKILILYWELIKRIEAYVSGIIYYFYFSTFYLFPIIYLFIIFIILNII